MDINNHGITIIENTKEDKNYYSTHSNGNHGDATWTITKEELTALQEGKCLAFNDDEYSTFIVMSK